MFLILQPELYLEQRYAIITHITPVLKYLHWLPVLQRCAFKTALLTFKAIHGQAPSYISELIKNRSPSRDLRSLNDILLDVPRSKSSNSSRAFVVSALSLWNSLPYDIRTSISLASVKSKLKTYLF